MRSTFCSQQIKSDLLLLESNLFTEPQTLLSSGKEYLISKTGILKGIAAKTIFIIQ